MNGAESAVAKEILKLYEKLQSAADGANEGEAPSVADEDRAVDLLNILKGLEISQEILLSTQVGKKLRKLSKHRSAKISAAASDLVENWKQQVQAKATANSPLNGKTATPSALNTNGSRSLDLKGPSPSSSNAPSPKPLTQPSPAQKNSDSFLSPKPRQPQHLNTVKSSGSSENDFPQRDGGGTSMSGSVKVEKLESKSSGATSGEEVPSSPKVVLPPLDISKLPKVGDKTRDKFRELVGTGLGMVANEVADEHRTRSSHKQAIAVTVAVETEMFKVYGGGKKDQEYKAKYRQITFNIKDKDNPDLRRRVLWGEVTPSQLLSMPAEEMASDERKREKMKIEKKMMFETCRGVNASASTDQFKCGKCGQRKTTYYQMQTRSADEPMTTFVSCLNCPNRWKFS